MPVYLCQPGLGQSEPWRHGVQVFSAPFPIFRDAGNQENDNNNNTQTGNVVVTTGSNNVGQHDLIVANWSPLDSNPSTRPSSLPTTETLGGERETAAAEDPGVSTSSGSASNNPIRRIRHAEVVLVDDVCIAFDRYWLRLRWPGNKGGFAGYVAMGLVSETNQEHKETFEQIAANSHSQEESPRFLTPTEALLEERGMNDEADVDDPAREETGSMPPSEPQESSSSTITCIRTGLPFQSSVAMQLLPVYDDGVSPPVALAPLPTEPVFCRICREGLHEDVDEEQPAAAEDGDGDPSRDVSSGDFGEDERNSEDADEEAEEEDSIETKGPVVPHPSYSANTDALQNPILAPCECAGSMAFVHYLCVEQWRCRSRHPKAHHGLHCETCGTAYTLPPPTERPVNVPQLDQEDWLEAMPPHVMQALRQPHIWWQIGAWIVRRRWLRPLAPVLMSPVVALYCRARRLLKKRGVARRRWACSLCRRRARWKCVRCLRSYYCSRQCQNVSWHIIHKHVCYKPSRFWWSVVIYSALSVAIFPGVLRDPLMYDIGIVLFPASFIIMGVLGGGFATFVKKAAGIDLRGRGLELAVVIATTWLVLLSWGLVKGFFSVEGSCHGFVLNRSVSMENLAEYPVLRGVRFTFLKPVQAIYRSIDSVVMNMGQWVRAVFCSNDEANKCFEHLPYASADFFFEDKGGESCAGDLALVTSLYLAAGIGFAGSAIWKHQERRRRRQNRRPGREAQHAHQD